MLELHRSGRPQQELAFVLRRHHKESILDWDRPAERRLWSCDMQDLFCRLSVRILITRGFAQFERAFCHVTRDKDLTRGGERRTFMGRFGKRRFPWGEIVARRETFVARFGPPGKAVIKTTFAFVAEAFPRCTFTRRKAAALTSTRRTELPVP